MYKILILGGSGLIGTSVINEKLRELLSSKLGVDITSSHESQFLGAIGAAIIGY